MYHVVVGRLLVAAARMDDMLIFFIVSAQFTGAC
jgi:hypothetical protein